MQLKRWISSIIALPLVIYAIHNGGIVFLIFMWLICLISLREYFRIALKGVERKHAISTIGYFTGCAMILAAYVNAWDVMLLMPAADLMLCAAVSVMAAKSGQWLIEGVNRQVQGIVYLPLLLSFLVLIRLQPNGITWIFSFLCIVFAGDIGAYYVGRSLGRHKLILPVSPGKTIEGAVGGLCANIAMGSVINWNLHRLPWGLDMAALPWGAAIIFFVVLGVTGQFGDLFVSQLKRAADVKDSGNILPGHGGLLDRIDALLFAAPAAYVFRLYVF
ncbi:MAG: phosphatidate cytidylyltransferase [Desulfobacterales bacterium]